MTNFAIIIQIDGGHSLAVVHGAADQYEALGSTVTPFGAARFTK